MNTRTTVVLFGALLLWGTAHADFSAALMDYNAGHYDTAHAQFLALAELGDCPSQFNLGAMTLQGQGVPKDRGAGVGWLQAALSNGCNSQVGDRLPRLTASLSPAEHDAAATVLARYGHEALLAQGVVSPDFRCRDFTPATVIDAPAAQFPSARHAEAVDALVLVAITIGTDGLARDPEILFVTPADGYAAPAVEAWLNSRFEPAQRHGLPVESRLQAKLRIVGKDGGLGNAQAFRTALTAAQGGDPAAQYAVGLAGPYDPSLGLSVGRSGQMLVSAARAGNPDSQYWVASQLRASDCPERVGGDTWLRHAAAGGSASAQVILASELLGGSPSAAAVSQARALLASASGSDNYYAQKHALALLAASPVESLRDPAAALRIAGRLAGGPIQSDPQMFEAVAAAYAANGQFDVAVSRQRTALARARALGWHTGLMKTRLDAYADGHAWTGELFAPPRD